MRRLLLITAVLLVSGCASLPNWPPVPVPTPTPTPTPTPPPDPSPVCKVGEEDCDCFVKPPGEDWKTLSCVPQRVCKNKVCTDPVTPPPPPPPPPTSDCMYPAVEGQLISTTDVLASRLASVLAGEAALGDLRRPGGGATLARENNRKLAAWLRTERGLCAFAGQEAVFVLGTQGLWEEYHAAAETDGGWTQNPYKGNHRNEGPVTSRPPDMPPIVVDACPVEPCPIRRWSADNLPPGWGDNEIGKSAWKFNAKLHTMGNCDSTPVTRNQEPYCRAIGMSPMADGNLRAACPMRNEIPGQPNPDREAVETWLLEGGPKREGRNGQVCTPNNTTNPFAFLCETGNCRICNTPGDTCSEWF